MITSLLLLLLAIILEICATSLLKHTNEFKNLKPSIFVILGYASAFYCLSIVVETLAVGIAYTLWCGLGIIGASIVAYFLHKQILNKMTILGMGFIIMGSVILAIYK